MTSRRPITDLGKHGNRWRLREESDEDLLEPDEDLSGSDEDFFRRNLPDKPGPARAPAKDMIREHRLVIAIDYGTTFTGQ